MLAALWCLRVVSSVAFVCCLCVAWYVCVIRCVLLCADCCWLIVVGCWLFGCSFCARVSRLVLGLGYCLSVDACWLFVVSCCLLVVGC